MLPMVWMLMWKWKTKKNIVLNHGDKDVKVEKGNEINEIKLNNISYESKINQKKIKKKRKKQKSKS